MVGVIMVGMLVATQNNPLHDNNNTAIEWYMTGYGAEES